MRGKNLSKIDAEWRKLAQWSNFLSRPVFFSASVHHLQVPHEQWDSAAGAIVGSNGSLFSPVMGGFGFRFLRLKLFFAYKSHIF